MIIHWNASPEIFNLGPLSLRWYGLLFAVGFALAYRLGVKIYRQEKVAVELVDSLIVYTVVGTVIGARLVHCLFYEPDYYLQNPLEILMVWKGGLASHGAVLGIFASILVFKWRHAKPSIAWMTDMVSVTSPIAAGCIRLGNVMNSEVYGKPTSGDWGSCLSESTKALLLVIPLNFMKPLFILSWLRLCGSTIKRNVKWAPAPALA